MAKFYTAFLYNSDSTYPHCTHKYLGEQRAEAFVKILDLIRDFQPEKIKAPNCSFDKVETFSGLVRVLSTSEIGNFRLWDTLRKNLGDFKKDEFQFNPHVSTPDMEPPLNRPFSHYAICTQETVLFAWPMMQKEI